MAKITRVSQKIFGSAAGTNQIAQFGSLAAAAPVFTTNPATIQALSNYLAGWYGAVIGSNSPAIEDMNALFYLYAYQLAYVLQAGVAEYDSGTTYYIGSIVNSSGFLYYSVIDTNLNQPLTDASKWKPVSSLSGGASVIIGSASYCTHATLAAAVADSNIGTNVTVLITESATISTTISLSKAGWRITAVPGVTYTKGGAATACISVAAAGINLSNLRVAGFSAGGNIGVTFTSGGDYGRVWNCNFSNCETDISDSAATAGRKPAVYGNITE